MSYQTEQEVFWAGNFGDEYTKRSQSSELVAPAIGFFAPIVKKLSSVNSVFELGASAGLNVRALQTLLPRIEYGAVEINAHAVEKLKTLGLKELTHNSILEYQPKQLWDLVLIKGVLIHIAPELLPQVYDKLYQLSQRYILIAEYYNPTPVVVEYRGHSNKLFKRDFAGEMLDKYPDLTLVDYGFNYHRDANFPQDDCTWFLLAKG